MKILHVMPANTGTIYYFLKEFYDTTLNDTHEFMVTSNAIGVMKYNTRLLAYPELQHVVGTETGKGKIKRFIDLSNRLKNYDAIIWHSFVPWRGNYAALLYFNKKILRKSAWIEWGEDVLYPDLLDKKVKRKLKEKMLSKVKRKISVVGITMPSDNKLLETNNNARKTFFVRYPIPDEIRELMISSCNKEKITTSIGIQVGLSAHPWNKHIKILNQLQQYKEENIHIYAPSNYVMRGYHFRSPNKVYISKVINKGKRVFDNKFVRLNRSIDYEMFFRYLNVIDVVVLDDISKHEYEYTMTYVMILLYLGKKIYMPSDSDMYTYLIANNVALYPSENIETMSFVDFIRNDENVNKNNEFILQYFDKEKIKLSWENFFAYIGATF